MRTTAYFAARRLRRAVSSERNELAFLPSCGGRTAAPL